MRQVICLLQIVVAISVLGCASTQSAFEQASDRGTIQAYEQFISQHSRDPLAKEARKRIVDIQLLDVKANGPGSRFVLPLNIGGGFRTDALFVNGGMQDVDFQWDRGGTGSMIAGDGSTFTFIGTNRFPDSAGPVQIGSMRAYIPEDLIGTEIDGSISTPLRFLLVRPYGLVHISGEGTFKRSDGKPVILRQ